MRLSSVLCLGTLLLCSLITSPAAFSQSKPQSPAAGAAASEKQDLIAQRQKALDLAGKNLHLEAFPIWEKIAASFPNDVDVWTNYGIALGVKSVTMQTPEERKPLRKRAYEALVRAQKLGTENIVALNLLEQLSPDGEGADNFGSDNPEAEKALREGEGYFGRGEFDKAFAAYERAYKLDPKSYEAALFAGDSFYAAHKYAESEPWFAKAVAINPNHESAYRYWGDALLGQNKVKEAREKFIDAFVAQPYVRYSWNNLEKLIKKYNSRPALKMILPPTSEPFEQIKIDETLLSEADGTIHWRKYKQVRETFKKESADRAYRHSLQEEVAALRALADAASAEAKSGKVQQMHHSLVNLMEINKEGFLEPYVLLLLPDDGIVEDYEAYREKNRAKLREFISKYIFAFKD